MNRVSANWVLSVPFPKPDRYTSETYVTGRVAWAYPDDEPAAARVFVCFV